MRAEPAVLSATATRARLLDALAPVVEGVERLGLVDPEELRIHVRPFPLRGERPGARLFLMAGARELSRGLAEDLPGGGAALSAAAEDLLALALSCLDDGSLDDAERLLGGPGVMVVIADPARGSVVVALTAAGRAVELGRLVDGPTVAH